MAYLKEEIKAGAIIVAAFLLLSGFVILIGGSQVFEKLDFYSMKVMNAAGIEEGTQVKLGGVRIGRVTAIIPPGAPGEPVTIKLGIRKGTVLYKGTKASIAQSGVVGDSYLLLSIENTTSGQFKPGDTIPTEPQVQFAVLMARLDSISQSVGGIVKNIDLIFSDKNIKEIESILENANSAVVSGSSNLEKVASALKGTTTKLELVLNEIEGFIKDNRAEVSPLIKSARAGVEKAGELLKTMEETAKSANSTIKTTDRVIDRQSQNMDNLLHTLNRTTEDLRDAMHEIKSKPWSVIYKEEKGKEE